MLPVISALLAFVASLVRSRLSLSLEHVALRHQLAVYKQTVHRPRLRPTDRLFWAWLSRLWPGWQSALAFVQPRTVIAWQHKRFRDYWRRLSQQGKPGRPAQFLAVCSSAKPCKIGENLLSVSDSISRSEERLIHAGALVPPSTLQR
jgi:hypothetical protein